MPKASETRMTTLPPTADLECDSVQGPPGLSWERGSCGVCGGTASRPVVRVSQLIYDRTGTLEIVRCANCRQLYLDPRPTRETIGLYYTADYGPHQESSATSDSGSARRPWYLSPLVRGIPGLQAAFRWLSDRYAELVLPPPEPGARALEIGCGSGRYLEMLAKAGWQAEGLEPGAEPAQRCRARGLAVQTGTFESVPFPQASYDLVVAWMVLEHLHDPGDALRRIRQLLTARGKLLLSVPQVGCWEPRVFGKHYYIFAEPTHLQHFTVRTLQRLLSEHGFPRHKIYFQANLNNVVGSLGLWLQSRFPKSSVGRRLIQSCDHYNIWGQLALAPAAKLLAALHQTGRITVVAQPGEQPQMGGGGDAAAFSA